MSSRVQRIALALFRAALVMAAAVGLATIPYANVNGTLLLGFGAAVGCAIAGFQTHPRRSLGLVGPVASGLFLLLLFAVLCPLPWSQPFFLIVGLVVGTSGPAWRSVAQLFAPWLPAAPLDAAFTVIMLPLFLFEDHTALIEGFGLYAVIGWALFAVPTLELLTEWVVWPMYDIRAHGPGGIPRRGPVLVIANHSTYADPFFISKIAPRKVTPMMTSVFYDLPGIRWLMIHVVGAIRVQTGSFRREAPELHEAVVRLRRGGCILLFPEGMLRRKEEQLLMSFGQGVWHILNELPQTPVVVCWIEGGWGSFASYRGGPPMKNKRLDWRRRIDIAVSEPRVLDASILADHRTTREALRQACLDCRKLLGLSDSDEDKEAPAETAVHPINLEEELR